MNNAKHTKGPWKTARNFKLDVDKFGLGVQQKVSVIESEPNFKIADVYDTAFPDLNQANAKLIAAAPDLLEALELCLDHGNLGTFGKDAISLVELVEQAIRKAKGEL